MLNTLPKNLIYEIMKHLESIDLHEFARTNKYYSKLYGNEDFWLRKLQFKLNTVDFRIPSYLTYRNFYHQLCQSGYLIHVLDQPPIASNVVTIRSDYGDGLFFITAHGKLFYYMPSNNGEIPYRDKSDSKLYSIADNVRDIAFDDCGTVLILAWDQTLACGVIENNDLVMKNIPVDSTIRKIGCAHRFFYFITSQNQLYLYDGQVHPIDWTRQPELIDSNVKMVSLCNHDTMDGELTEIYYIKVDGKLYVYRFEVTHADIKYENVEDFRHLNLNIDHNLLLTGQAQIKRFKFETEFTNVVTFAVSPNNLVLCSNKRDLMCVDMFCKEISQISFTTNVRKIIICKYGMAVLDEKNNLYACPYPEGYNYFTHRIRYETPHFALCNVLDVACGATAFIIRQL